MKLFVEGGGETNALRTACREGFTKFITVAGIRNRPRVVACGSRNDAFDSFCTALKNKENAMLLVDSETAIVAACQQGEPEQWTPWVHLHQRQGDEWNKPDDSLDTQCHLMVECMESWLLTDRIALKQFFAQGFKEASLPAANRPIEDVRKAEIYVALKRATAASQKGEYGKGDHSFKLLAEIDPAQVTQASPWAKRFIDELKKAMDG